MSVLFNGKFTATLKIYFKCGWSESESYNVPSATETRNKIVSNKQRFLIPAASYRGPSVSKLIKSL